MTEAVRTMEKMGMGMGKMIGISKAFSKVGIDLAKITAKVASAQKEDPYTRVLVSAVRVLQKLGVDIGYLYEDEPCCGSPVYYAGFLDEYVAHAEKNCEVFKSQKVKKLIGFLPACTSALRNIYPQYVDGYSLEVQQFFEIVAQRLRETQIKPKLKEKLTVTFHEPCQLSRYLNIVDAPREVMNRIEGLELREPEQEQRKQWSTCCGGGGLEVSSPGLSERLGAKRIEELLKTGAPVIVTNCPGCMMQLANSVRKLGANVKIWDVAEILDQALE
jgi:heterodisulfide reductase subunit D